MIIDLRELVHQSGRIDGEVNTRIDDPVVGEVVVACRVAVSYRQAQGIVYLHGTVEGDVATVCHRCLEPATAHLEGDFDVMVRRGEHEGEAGDDVVVLATHEHEMAMEPFVHEALVLSAPMIVLCRDDCRGLCPTCGAYLNAGPCRCTASADPRWDALRRMKSD